jgi:hypothetical protein
MPRRAAIVTQADIARTIRAMADAGLNVVRCVTRADGVAIETSDVDVPTPKDRPAIEAPAVGGKFVL